MNKNKVILIILSLALLTFIVYTFSQPVSGNRINHCSGKLLVGHRGLSDALCIDDNHQIVD